MDRTPSHDLSPAAQRRFVARGLIRALISAAVLVSLYFLLPLTVSDVVPLWVVLSVALLILLVVTVVELRGIVRSPQPGLRGIEALAVIAPLYLLLFAAAYFSVARADPASFGGDVLTRVDSLYLTVTIFSTVGFGDITPVTESARLLVTFQMILNLIVLGAGLRLLTAAVRQGRQAKNGDGTESSGSTKET